MRTPRGHVLGLLLLAGVATAVGGPAAVGAGAAEVVRDSTDSSAMGPTDQGREATAGTPACAGVVAAPANGITVVSVQGYRFGGPESGKARARLVAFGSRGQILWVHESWREPGVVWSYDVDPLANGNVFVTATRNGSTLLYELNATTGAVAWTERLPFNDTHDADPLNRTHVVVAQMRNADPANGTNDDRILVYDRVDDEIEWTWRFAPRYPRDVGGNYTEDWTHVNDVDAVNLDGEGARPSHFLVSPRNFDQVILVNRTSGAIAMRLGANRRHSVLRQQHNPDFLASDAGTPTILVADSENDRVVEYARRGDEWVRTWRIGSDATLDWPRDADRLRNGHTLVVDSRNSRVLEVTPRGRVVWEVYAPWLVYDAERVPARGFDAEEYRDLGGSRGPTMAEIAGAGSYDLEGASPPSRAALERCAAVISSHEGGFATHREATRTPTSAGTITTATDVPSASIVAVGRPQAFAWLGTVAILVVLAVLVRYRS